VLIKEDNETKHWEKFNGTRKCSGEWAMGGGEGSECKFLSSYKKLLKQEMFVTPTLSGGPRFLRGKVVGDLRKTVLLALKG